MCWLCEMRETESDPLQLLRKGWREVEKSAMEQGSREFLRAATKARAAPVTGRLKFGPVTIGQQGALNSLGCLGQRLRCPLEAGGARASTSVRWLYPNSRLPSAHGGGRN